MNRIQLAVPSLVLLALIGLQACQSQDDYIPKPRTYPRVDYPERSYEAFEESYCAFTFERPAYAQVIQDTMFFDEAPDHPCWFDLYYPAFAGKLHCSYAAIDDQENTLTRLVDDAYKLAFKHTSKAVGIGEEAIYLPEKNVYGIIFPLEGSVASPYQFFVTDSTEHFMRGSLYFNTSPNPDSMRPVIQFVKEDIERMLQSFEWK